MQKAEQIFIAHRLERNFHAWSFSFCLQKISFFLSNITKTYDSTMIPGSSKSCYFHNFSWNFLQSSQLTYKGGKFKEIDFSCPERWKIQTKHLSENNKNSFRWKEFVEWKKLSLICNWEEWKNFLFYDFPCNCIPSFADKEKFLLSDLFCSDLFSGL